MKLLLMAPGKFFATDTAPLCKELHVARFPARNEFLITALQNIRECLDSCTLMQYTALKVECVAQARQRTAGIC